MKKSVRMRRLWSLVILAGLIGVRVPTPSSAEPGVLAGTTTISGDRTGRQVVSIPADTNISAFHLFNNDVMVEGTAELSGIVLASQDEHNGTAVVIVSPASLRSWCIASYLAPFQSICPHALIVQERQDETSDVVELPAGLYDLYFFTDGGSASYTLHLDGLAGETTILPQTEASVTLDSLDAMAPVSGSIWWSGSSGSAGQGGMAFSAHWFRVTGYIGDERGFCYYEGSPAVDQVAYLPGCPLATFSQGWLLLFPAAASFGWSNSADFDAAGTSSRGWWLVSAGLVEEAHGVNLWIEYP